MTVETKPVIVELTDSGVGTESLVKQVPYEKIWGDSRHPGGTFNDLLLYLLDPSPDTLNPAPYSGEELNRARGLAAILARSRNDGNLIVRLSATNMKNEYVHVPLECRITEYLTATDENILGTRVLDVGGEAQTYNSLDMRLDTHFTGGRI